MSRELRATAILDAKDNTSGAFRTAEANLLRYEGRLKTLNGRQKAMERASANRMEERGGMLSRVPGGMRTVGTAIAGSAVLAYAGRAHQRFADVERAMLRVGITGDATNDEIATGLVKLRELAQQVAMPFDQIREGMDAVTASGRQFSDAMKMMPSIARTAQASGAKVDDIAKASTAMVQHLKIPMEELQAAQDVIAAGGKMGQFELKDMARYLPSFMPSGYLAGFKGLPGLQKMVAMLQTVREGSGTSEEAASSWENIMNKFESNKTQKELQDLLEKMGAKSDHVKKRFEEARKSGENLVEVFLELTKKATKGDYSKLGDIIDDSQFKRGVVALLTMEDKLRGFEEALSDVGGTVERDLNRVLGDTTTKVTRLSEAFDRLTTAVGQKLAGTGAVKEAANSVDIIARAVEQGGFENLPEYQAAERRGQMDRAKKGLHGALGDETSAERAMRQFNDDLRRRMVADPNIINRSDVRRNFEMRRAAIYEARKRSGDYTQKLLPQMDGDTYQIPGLAIDAYRPGNRRLPADHQDRLDAHARNGYKPVKGMPLPPTRPDNGSIAFQKIPPLDFDGAKSSAEQGKTDIETIMRGLDLTIPGQQAGSSMRTGLSSELKAAEAEADGWIARMKSKFTFTISPKVTTNLPQGQSRAGSE